MGAHCSSAGGSGTQLTQTISHIETLELKIKSPMKGRVINVPPVEQYEREDAGTKIPAHASIAQDASALVVPVGITPSTFNSMI